jgi:hypothetical protein
MSTDYIPAKDADFDRWFKYLNQYVALKCGGQTPEWTNIPAAARTEVQNAYADWYTAYAKTFGPHTPVDTEGKNDARKAAEARARPFIQQYLMFPPVTNEDRTAMGLHNKDNTRTPDTAPATYPEAESDSSVIRQITVHFKDSGALTRAKPAGVHGAEINHLALKGEVCCFGKVFDSGYIPLIRPKAPLRKQVLGYVPFAYNQMGPPRPRTGQRRRPHPFGLRHRHPLYPAV